MDDVGPTVIGAWPCSRVGLLKVQCCCVDLSSVGVLVTLHCRWLEPHDPCLGCAVSYLWLCFPLRLQMLPAPVVTARS